MERNELRKYIREEFVDNALIFDSKEQYDISINDFDIYLNHVQAKDGDVIIIEKCKEKTVNNNTMYAFYNINKFWRGGYFVNNNSFNELVKCLSNKYHKLGLSITTIGIVEED